MNKNEIYEEIISILDTLKDLDKDRRNRYEDQSKLTTLSLPFKQSN